MRVPRRAARLPSPGSWTGGPMAARAPLSTPSACCLAN
ncbi:Protein of unknown function [Gryllus bimaculatus]|nr:Protein of unknown function [Gryllus bimaculatus]